MIFLPAGERQISPIYTNRIDAIGVDDTDMGYINIRYMLAANLT